MASVFQVRPKSFLYFRILPIQMYFYLHFGTEEIRKIDMPALLTYLLDARNPITDNSHLKHGR